MLNIFYQKRSITGKKHLRFRQPTILISNHPNTLIDPLTVASLPSKQVFFLGNAGLFSNAFTHWLFSTLYVIPIMRPGDKSYKAVNNNDSFRKCYQHLAQGGAIYIAPEGGSFVGRKVRPFKTGTARIALEAEKVYNFELNVQILPIGLVYDYPHKFGSLQLINIGEPLLMQDYKAAYLERPVETFKQLTHQLEDTIKKLTLHYESDAEDLFNYQFAEVLRTESKSEIAIFNTLKDIQKGYNEKQKKDCYSTTRQYFEALRKVNTSDKAFFESQNKQGYHLLKYILGLLIGFPLFLYGGINNLIVALLPYITAKKIKIYPGYIATIKTLTGLIALPVFYTFQYHIVKHYFGNPIAWYYLFSLLPLGLFAWKYFQFSKNAQLFFRALGVPKKEKAALLAQRKKVLKFKIS